METPQPVPKNMPPVIKLTTLNSFANFGADPSTVEFWANWWNLGLTIISLFIPLPSRIDQNLLMYFRALCLKRCSLVQRCAFWSLVDIVPSPLRSNPQESQFWSASRLFLAKHTKYYNLYSVKTATSTATKFCTVIDHQVLQVVQISVTQIQDGGRPQSWKSKYRDKSATVYQIMTKVGAVTCINSPAGWDNYLCRNITKTLETWTQVSSSPPAATSALLWRKRIAT